MGLKRILFDAWRGKAKGINARASLPSGLEAESMRADLAFPAYQPSTAPQVFRTDASPGTLHEIRLENRAGIALISVCTLNYLHVARTLVASVRQHHRAEEMAIYVLLVDWDGQEPVDFPDVHLVAGRAIGIDGFAYMALKLSATELCCACKPYFMQYVMATTNCHKLLYIDSDIYIFARLDELIASLDQAPLVVMPHTFLPPPLRDGANVVPRMGDILDAGSYNAGLIGMTVTSETAELVRRWAELLAVPAALFDEHGLGEQRLFNWLVSLTEGVKVLKNPAYNVAYWNLHDRSLRYTCWDDPLAQPGWRVDGAPLVAFHFSGFSLSDPRRLSRHDNRNDLFFLPSIATLVEFYVRELASHGGLAVQAREYGFSRFPSGLPITPEMRAIFRKHEPYLRSGLNPWSAEGEAFYAQRLFLPVPQTASLLPVALYYIYQQRPDLQAAFPQAHLRPEGMLHWFACACLDEGHELADCYHQYRPVVPKRAAIGILQKTLRLHASALIGIERPMSRDRSTLVLNLRKQGSNEAARKIQSADSEYFALSPIYLLRKFVEQEAWLKDRFPDLLFDDAPAFAAWLQQHAASCFLPPELSEVFLRKAQGHSLARVFSWVNDPPSPAEQWPLLLVGQNKDEFLTTLLSQLPHERQFDLDDVMMFAWIMEVKPWAGVPLTFELRANASRQPSLSTVAGQEALLAPVLQRPEFRGALAAYQNQMSELRRHRPQPGFAGMEAGGANMFGFFKSPIGLGNLSHGLALAFGAANLRVQKNVLSLASMDNDLRPEDFVGAYDGSLQTNVFISYPHLSYRLLETYPAHVVKQRRNVIYLAWEQRDGYVSWEEDYAPFDQVWALSEFAAGSFRRYMKRAVLVVPSVLDFDAFPAAAGKADIGFLNPDRFTFLYVFDAHSSIERKNPEAAVRAFARAFSPEDKVQLLFKVTNAHRLDCQARLRRLTNLAARTGLDIQFVMERLPRDKVLGLISAVDCYVSLHRAEGFGYTCAEAMAYARPVIATNYSATTEFIDAESGFPVDCQECEVAEADGPFQRGSVWGDPNIEHAAWQMRQVYRDPQAARAIAEAGRDKVRRLFSAERVGRVVASTLSQQSYSHAV